MGCGQSKINLYPRRNKNGGKGNSAKKSGAVDKEADEEEGSAAAASPPDEPAEDPDRQKSILPLTTHTPAIEISASQQDFFKMLDEKIDLGRDYDSSSETELRIEHERRRQLLDQWRSASQSSQSHSSPPTPARRRMPRPMPQLPDRQSSPGATRRCYRQQHITEGMSPPPRRTQSAQSHHPDQRQQNGGKEWLAEEAKKSPVKRPQSAGANWKNNPKVAPFNQKPKKNEANEQHRTQKDIEQTKESQITFNPTFQTHSPAHSVKDQQPFKAQIISYPMSQQITPPSPPKYIAPPEEYQDTQNEVSDNKFRQTPTPTQNAQPPIYYIHGNTSTATQDLVQQRQQTAIHLQQYVAMKQAQQQMFSYFQRGPHTVFPNTEQTQYSQEHEEYQYSHGTRPHSAPTPVGVVRPMVPGFVPEGAHMTQMPMWSPMPAVVSSMGPWVPGQAPEGYQFYQSPYMQGMYRPGSAGSTGTLTRYHKERPTDQTKNNVCQSINLVRQKPVGQIVMGQELTVCTNSSESPSPASVSTDSGVSPGNSVSNSKTPVFSPPFTPVPNTLEKNKKNKSFGRSLKNSKSLDSS